MTLDEIREKVKTLPNEMRISFSEISNDIICLDGNFKEMKINGEITEEQYKTWKECVKCNINLLLM